MKNYIGIKVFSHLKCWFFFFNKYTQNISRLPHKFQLYPYVLKNLNPTSKLLNLFQKDILQLIYYFKNIYFSLK